MGDLCVVQRRLDGRFWKNHLPRLLTLFLFLPLFSSPLIAEAVDDDLEQDLQKSLTRSKTLVAQIKTRTTKGASVTSELAQLKAAAENIKISNLLLEERFKLRAEKVKTLGAKAVERHDAMVGGYRQALIDYLTLIDNLPSGGTISQSAIRNLLSLLEKTLPKRTRPIIGSLPYKHLNYPAVEPISVPEIIPAYKGGNKTVSPDDTAATPEAPISSEIATLAQSLNWSPVSIYEYVKNNIETEWYRGCQKGAEETLHQRSGNDCDQAALLTALLRASGFPTRYVRGVIQFFPGIERARNLIGIDDPMKIAEFLRKAGIPCTPVIAGGTISNFQIEHVWVESQIPYSNYRGAIIDDRGKTWLGLDTSIKVKGYTYNSSQDILSSMSFSTIRDEYLGLSSQHTNTQAPTPLEFLQSSINSELQAQNSQLAYADFLRTRVLVPEVLNILPASLQFTLVKATNEYTAIPDELKHKVRFVAKEAQNSELLNIELDTYKLSNQQIAISYEPETVQDQEIIDSYGGLDNTPAYLVHLRPVLKVNGERIVVAQDGVPMGGEFNLTIDLISPNGTQSITNSHIVGNLSVIGIIAQKAALAPSPLAGGEACTEQGECGGGEGAKDAERLLYEEANHYIARWNKAEEELASLLHLSITRPIPTVVTVGGVIDVTYLLDMPHGFTWKGVFIDASERAIEAVASDESRVKTFMQLASLQGSILENRIFEDDFKAESISTVKLFQLAGGNTQLITIDKTNIAALLPTIPFDDNIKEDMANAVNQGFELRTLNSELVFRDWTGTGYLKEKNETGESGWMLSGMIAGGSTADAEWLNNLFLQQTLSTPYAGQVNHDPLAGVRMYKIPATDRQNPKTVGTALLRPFAAAVLDGKDAPVAGATVTFRVIAGGGKIQCLNQTEVPVGEPSEISCDAPTSNTGIAKATLTLGVKTDANPDYMKLDPSDENYTQIGLNLVTASAASHSGTTALNGPFEAYGKPDVPAKIVKVYPLKSVSVMVNNPAGSLLSKVTDVHGNPVSNVRLTFHAESAESNDPANDPLPADHRNLGLYTRGTCTNPYPVAGDCALSSSLTLTTYYYGAQVETLLGNTLNTHYTVAASAAGLTAATFDLYSEGGRSNAGEYVPTVLMTWNLGIVNDKGEPVNASKAGTELKAPLAAKMFLLQDDYDIQSEQCTKQDSSGNTVTYPGYSLASKGTMSIRPITDGSVTFTTKEGNGTAAQTQNMGSGLYRATYRTGAQPAKNIIEANGSATVIVPKIYGVNQSGGYVPKTKCLETANIPTATVTLQHGEYALFDQNTNELANVYATGMKPTYTVYGVDTQLAVEPSIILLNDLGFTTVDTRLTYTILPQEYNAIRTDLDSYKTDQSNTETWDGYVVANKTQGQGTAVFVAGTLFDITQLYNEQVVLNRGTDMEIRGEKKVIPVAQVTAKDDNNASVDEMKFGRGERLEKIYHIDLLSRAFVNNCTSQTGKITVKNQNGQTITTPSADGRAYAAEYPLEFYSPTFPLGNNLCKARLKDTLDGGSNKGKFIVSNLPRSILDVGFPFPNLYNTAVLYGGLGNQAWLEVSGSRTLIPIEPVGVVIFGIDGLRQDVLYPAELDDVQENGQYRVDINNLSGLKQVLAGYDQSPEKQQYIMLPKVTTIFPSITFAAWASIFTGKMPNETGILGNEFFARDLYDPNSASNQTIPGMASLPSGMVTLDADGGALRAAPSGGLLSNLLVKVNDSAPFALNHVMPAEFLGYDTSSKKFVSSAPRNALKIAPLWKTVNDIVSGRYQINTADRCDQSSNECRTVSMFNQYTDDVDWWGTPSVKWMTLWKAIWDGSIFDSASTSETVDFISNYFKQTTTNGKRKRFPALFSVYLPGLDHDAHMNGMGHYKTFFQDTVDAKVSQIVNSLKSQGEFDNKIFIVVSDHGHTAMPTDLTYIQEVPMQDVETQEPYIAQFPRQAEMSCILKTNFAVNSSNDYEGKNAQNAELENNSLHIWELGELFKSVGKFTGGSYSYRVLAPDPIAKLFSKKEAYGARASISEANVIAALNGPMAHIYLTDQYDMGRVAEIFRLILQTENITEAREWFGLSEDGYADLRDTVGRLQSSLSQIVVRVNGNYCVFDGLTDDGSPKCALFDAFNDSAAIDAWTRINGMNHKDRSGDIVLIMKDTTTGDATGRYTTAYACKSWHGSLNPSDSYVPFIVSYPGGNKIEIENILKKDTVCNADYGNCKNNWKLPTIVKGIISEQYK